MKNEFNPRSDLTTEDTAQFIRDGDIDSAELLGNWLRVFLQGVACNPNAIDALKSWGVAWIGISNAQVIIDALARPASNEKGKTNKSGAEMFAKFLVPNKPTKNQIESLFLASYVHWNKQKLEEHLKENGRKKDKSTYEYLAEYLNGEIDKANVVRKNHDAGKFDKTPYNLNLPKRRITAHQLENAYRTKYEFIKEKEKLSDVLNGITTTESNPP